MKKSMLALLVVLCLLLAGCSSTAEKPAPSHTFSWPDAPTAGAELALLVDEAQRSTVFAQATATVLSHFAGERQITSGTYSLTGETQSDVQSAVELAIKGGARVIVGIDQQGTLFGQVAQQYPDILFLLLQVPAGYEPGGNVVGFYYPGEQLGWLAGYMAVSEGGRYLVYAAEEGDVASGVFGLGFWMGADAAASALQLEKASIQARLRALAPGASGMEWRTTAEQIYGNTGALLVAPSGPSAVLQTIALQQGGSLMLVDPDALDETTGFMGVRHTPRNVLPKALSNWMDGSLAGGQIIICGIEAGGMIPVEELPLGNFGSTQLAAVQTQFGDTDIAEVLRRLCTPDDNGALPAPGSLNLSHLAFDPGIDRLTDQGSSSSSSESGSSSSSAENSTSTQT